MLLMSQCQAFQLWAPNYWAEGGFMKETCDLIETQDLMDWQTLTNHIQVYGPDDDKLPNVSSSGVSLSTLFAAHHNLVTYGVPFEWVRPGPNKRFYAPEEAVAQIAKSKMFESDALVQKWYAAHKGKLVPDAIENMPGMAKWVQLAQACWSSLEDRAACNETFNDIGDNWPQVFEATHPVTESED